MAHDPNSLLIERGTEALRESIERDTRRYEAGPPARALDGGGDDAPSNSGLLTQDSVALRFAREAADRMLFDHHRGRWYFWEKTRWGQDEVKRGFQYARLLTRLESGSSDAEEIKAARRATFAGGVERFAQSDPTFAVTSEIWDKDPFLLGTPGAIVDLRTGIARKHDPDDRITKLTAVTPAQTANCPICDKFLQHATGGDAETINFLQQYSGYCLTGDTREHVLGFLFGGGGTGKSAFANVLKGVLGDYAVTAAMETFTTSIGERHSTELAVLHGARVVIASETEEGRTWAESRIKSMTGGDPITARFMRRDFFTFQPKFKILICGNHMPQLRNVDDAMRRRFRIVPFKVKPEKPDLELQQKLRSEWPEILRWMIDGCLDWQKHGLVSTKSVSAENDAYFSEQDSFVKWIEESCVVSSISAATTADLFGSWGNWAKRNGEEPGNTKRFSQAMGKAGFMHVKNVPGHTGKRGFEGIALQPVDTSKQWQNRDS